MKSLLLFIFLTFGIAQANTFMVEGELKNISLNGKVVATKILALQGEFFLSGLADNASSCFQGVYEVDSVSLELVNIVRCDDKQRMDKSISISDEVIFCAAVYQPVCGIVTETSTPKTFSNTCELNKAKAKKIFNGKCELALNELTVGASVSRFIK